MLTITLIGMAVVLLLSPVLIVLAADRHPQYVSFEVIESAPNTYTQVQIPLPLGLVGGAQKNMALEVTSVWWDNTRPDVIAGNNTRMEAHISTQSRTAVGSLNNPDVIDKLSTTIISPAAPLLGVVDFEPNNRPTGHDLTTGDGFGPLVAAQLLFVGVQGENNINTKTARGRMYYRLRTVSTAELLGLAAQLTQGGA